MLNSLKYRLYTWKRNAWMKVCRYEKTMILYKPIRNLYMVSSNFKFAISVLIKL